MLILSFCYTVNQIPCWTDLQILLTYILQACYYLLHIICYTILIHQTILLYTIYQQAKSLHLIGLLYTVYFMSQLKSEQLCLHVTFSLLHRILYPILYYSILYYVVILLHYCILYTILYLYINIDKVIYYIDKQTSCVHCLHLLPAFVAFNQTTVTLYFLFILSSIALVQFLFLLLFIFQFYIHLTFYIYTYGPLISVPVLQQLDFPLRINKVLGYLISFMLQQPCICRLLCRPSQTPQPTLHQRVNGQRAACSCKFFFNRKLTINHDQAVNEIHHNNPNCILFVCNLNRLD